MKTRTIDGPMMGRRRSRGLLLLAGALAFLGGACAEGEDVPGTEWRPDPEFALEFAGPVVLNQDLVRPGESFLCSLRFVNNGASPPAREYRVFLHIETDEEECQGIVFQDDHDPDPPTRWWAPGEVIDLGARLVEVPKDQEEGEFRLHAGLFYLHDEWRVLDSGHVSFTVSDDAPLLEDWEPEPLSELELASRREAIAERLPMQHSVQTSRWRFSVGGERAAFQLEDRQSGALWSSNPLHDRLGLVHLSQGDKRLTLPLEHIDDTYALGDGLRIECLVTVQDDGEQLRLELDVEPVAGGAGVAISWRAPAAGKWTIDAVSVLDQAFPVTDAEGGTVVTPQWLGELSTAAGALPQARRFYSHDISMQMAGLTKQGSALLVTWEDHYAALTSHAALYDHPLIAGRAVRRLSLELTRESPKLELYPLGAGNYVDIARAYRGIAERRGHRMTLAEKRERDESVAQLVGAPFFRLECLIRDTRLSLADDAAPVVAECLHTFDEVAACARHWREDLGIDRAQILLGGWNRGGYDGGHPDILPANAECGGNDGLAACAASVRELGYLFGLHDNYQDIYSDSPSWDPELLGHGEFGEMLAGGVWAGGQSWMLCTTQQLRFARRNLPRVQELFRPDFCFLDTTLTTRLQECTHSDHPLEPLEDRAQRLELFGYARDTFGLLGLEGAREWAVPQAHFFEGVLSHRTSRSERSTPVPLFPIVYGDCVNLLTMQRDRLDPWDAVIFLDHLLYGEMPMYSVGDHEYWRELADEQFLSEVDARDPRFAFARADQGWAVRLGAIDSLIKNTWEVLSYLHRAIGDAPMTEHAFLRVDKSAETSAFGDVRVTVNYSAEPLNIGSTILGEFGFLIESPRYIAFHALRFGGVEYPHGACFTMRSLDEAPIAESRSIRVFHAFGDPTVRLPQQIERVEREKIVER